MYLSHLEEEMLSLSEKPSYSNLTKWKRNALLRDDPCIIIKEASKGSMVVVWDRQDYVKETDIQISDKDVYWEVKADIESPLIKVMKSAIRKIRNAYDIKEENLVYG